MSLNQVVKAADRIQSESTTDTVIGLIVIAAVLVPKLLSYYSKTVNNAKR